MKDNLLDGHRGKVAANVTTTPTGSGKTEVVGGPGPTNFDDDYNEWELGIGDLIIDLDADIEKNNDKYHGLGEGGVTFGLLTQQSCDLSTTSSMSNSKQCRMTGNSNSSSNSSSGGSTSSTGTAGTVEHQATVDKGLKMKIKRKNVGSKFSEAKHEIVQSDTKVAHQTPTEVAVTSNCTQNNQQAESKSKHSSSKGRSTSHREKKEKNKDKNNSKTTTEVNGVVNNTHSVVSASIKLSNNNNGTASSSSSTPPAPVTALPPAPTPISACDANNAVTTTNCLPSIMPSLTVKLETKYSSLPANSTVLLKPEDLPKSPPPKRARVDKADPMRDAGTSTSVGTITEPECLGPCEPGTSVTLEGIVWQETEGGVLVVNVTWRGKTYVGTLLDCTKHDWAPPRFCESPTSDIDAKTSKARGKRGRASTGTANEVNNYNESRATVQSKLRNCKGRRSTSNSSNSTNSGFTVPSSPAKSDASTCSNGKRKGRPADLELNVTNVDNKGSKRSRSQARSTPTPNSNALTDFTQPSSPVLIECPEPNCSKKYKHINGLRYHQTHAHSNSEAGKIEDMLEDGKDTTNSSDNDESMQDSASVSPSPAITTFPSSVSPHSHDSNNRTLSAPESLNILDMSTPAEGESYPEATDLSTLASVAISDSKKNNAFVHLTTTNSTSSSSVIKCQENGETSANSETTKPICVNIPISGAPANLSSHVGLTATSPVSLSSPSLTNYATNTSSNSSVPSVTASIPTSHVLFSQTCTVGSSTTTMNLTSTPTMSAMCSVQSNNITTFFTPSVPSTGSALPSAGDKSKLEKADKYKIKSSGAAIVRPVIPVPPTQVLSTSNAPQPSSTSHSHVTSSLKPIQPKPTILGEPATINPALESLKKEKSKHKKKNKERDKDKKGSSTLQSTKSQLLPSTEEAERIGRSSFDSLESPLTKTITNATGISPSQQKPIVASLGNAQSLNSDSNPADSSNINENVQSPAYSDISDANDSAPVLESEVPNSKDKDEVKSPPDVASQTAATSLSTYGMYSYYGNPPYLLPSVPQNSVPSSTLNVEKGDSEKKSEADRSKDVRNWNCQPSEVKIENANVSQEKTGKKTPSEEAQVSSNISSAVSSSSNGQQDYPMQQQYAYPYGYMQGYPSYTVDASYHMHLLTTDPHYKQQCDHYMEEQERIYREQAERQKEQVERQHKEHIEKQHKEHIEKQHKEHIEKQHKEHIEKQHKEHIEKQHKEHIEKQHKEQERHHKEQERHHKEQERHHKEQERHHKEQERHHKEQERQHKDHSEKHHKDQSERQHKEHVERQHKDQSERHKLHIQHSQMRSKDDRNREKITEEKGIHSSLSGASVPSDLSKQASVGNTVIATKDREIRPPSHPSQSRTESSTTPSISPVVSTATPLKDKQNENHQILKENIELKSQMDAGKVKLTHYESAMLYDRQHEMRRYYMMQEGLMDTHQKPDREHSQQQQPIQGRKEDQMFSTVVMKNKSCTESTRPTSVILSPKSDSAKSLSSSSSSSSPKGTSRESSLFSKDYSANNTSSKKESSSSVKPVEHSESSSRDDKHKSDRGKSHAEGQKPTMETTGPPPPPTNSYAYIQPSYIQPSHLQPTHLQPSHPHFAHIPFESIYRGSLSPMLMSTPPHYGGSHFIHPQLRYHVPSAPCEIPPHSQTVSDSLGTKLHTPTQAKALDLLHQVSQHYTCTTHKIHELHERALMSPTASSAPSTAPGSSQSKASSSESATNSAKQEAICVNERSQSPPPQRHLHTHHHTHVGVGYPIYDPYGAAHQHWKQAQNQRRVPYRLTDQCDLMGKKIKEQEVP